MLPHQHDADDDEQQGPLESEAGEFVHQEQPAEGDQNGAAHGSGAGTTLAAAVAITGVVLHGVSTSVLARA